MESQRISMAKARSGPGRATQLLASLLGLAAAVLFLAQSAQAANDAIIDCDRLESSLRSLEVPAADLPLESGASLESTQSELLDSALESEASAPVLRLTPRIADVMREVFDALPNAADTTTAEADSADEPAKSQAPLVNTPAAAVPIRSESEAPDQLTTPRYQRQMYRTDI